MREGHTLGTSTSAPVALAPLAPVAPRHLRHDALSVLVPFPVPRDVDPRLGDEEPLEQRDRVAVGHAGEEVPGGRVHALLVDRSRVEELGRPLADLSQSPPRMPEALRNSAVDSVVLVDGLEEEARAAPASRPGPRRSSESRPARRERRGDDVLHHPPDPGGRRGPEHRDGIAPAAPPPQQPGPDRVVDVVVDVGDEVRQRVRSALRACARAARVRARPARPLCPSSAARCRRAPPTSGSGPRRRAPGRPRCAGSARSG